MSKLEELIARLCPDGVEYKSICDIADTFIGLATSVTKYKSDEGVLLLHNSDIKDGKIELKKIEYITEEFAKRNFKKILRTNDVITVHTGDVGTSAVVTQEYDGAIGFTTITSRIKNSKEILPEYLCKYLNSGHFKAAIYSKTISDRSNLNLDSFDKIKVPVPPLEVQREIVHILDSFTFLTAELAAELAARQKQYEFYRDALLTFKNIDDTILNERTNELELSSVVRWMKLGDLCRKIVSGGTPTASRSDYYNGVIPWLRTQEVDWKYIYDTGIKITQEGYNNSSAKWIPKNCVIVAMYGATAAKTAINKIPLTTNQACCNLEIDDNKASYKYVYYWLCKEYLALKALGQGSQNNINANIVKNYPIPVPPLSEQQRIVDILDRFDALCNDITSGLPAEIEARKKQYEYYRDKLLTFKELKKEA